MRHKENQDRLAKHNKENCFLDKNTYSQKLPPVHEAILLESKAKDCLRELSDDCCSNVLLQRKQSSQRIETEKVQSFLKKGKDVFSPWSQQDISREALISKISKNSIYIKNRKKKSINNFLGEKTYKIINQNDPKIDESNFSSMQMFELGKSSSKQQIPTLIQSKEKMKRYPSQSNNSYQGCILQKIRMSKQKQPSNHIKSNIQKQITEQKKCIQGLVAYRRISSNKQNQYTQIIACMKKKKKSMKQNYNPFDVQDGKRRTILKNLKNYSKIYQSKSGSSSKDSNEKMHTSIQKPHNPQSSEKKRPYFQKQKQKQVSKSKSKDQSLIYETQFWKIKNNYQCRSNSLNYNGLEAQKLKKQIESTSILSKIHKQALSHLSLNKNQIKPVSQNPPLKHWARIAKKNSQKKHGKSEQFQEYHSNNPLTRLLYEKYLNTISVGNWNKKHHVKVVDP